MNISIHGADLNAAMRVIKKCINPKDQRLASVEISHNGQGIALRGTNGNLAASVSIPLMCEEFESFCVDGSTFASVVATKNREIEISADGHACVIRGGGRTRIPILNGHVPEIEAVHGARVTVEAGAFARMCEQIKHAISADQGRIVLTGALVQTDGAKMTMTALDGFRLAREEMECGGDEVKMLIPGGFLSVVSSSVFDGERLEITTDGKTTVVRTDSVTLKCGLLSGEYVDVAKVMPETFRSECLVRRRDVLAAIKDARAVIGAEKLVRIAVVGHTMKVSGNSESADYEAEIDCEWQGDESLNIAFNSDYLNDALNTIDADEVVMRFNGPMSPVVVARREGKGIRLVLPVRTR